MYRRVLAIVVIFSYVATVQAQSSFVNWESPPVHPLELTPDGTHLIVANTPDNRVEIFEVTAGGLTHVGAVPVGLDPVSVRAASNTSVWVSNLISDTISIVDLSTLNVVETISTGDEPADIVFAGDPERAFVTISQLNQVWVYDPADLTVPPVVLDIAGEDPRALATDGSNVYVAIFESGNGTTILSQAAVSSNANPYAGDANPPPNDGTAFDPPLAPGLPVPPEVGLIVKKDNSGNWFDDNGGDWSAAVSWDLHDHDVAVIDADSLAVSYVSGLMNADMGIAVSPGGAVTVVGIDAINEIRFEPNVQGGFVQVIAASFDPGGGTPDIIDLNPHLDYSVATVSQELRDQSVGDPRGIAWSAIGDRGYVVGMGSNNVAVIDSGFNRLGLIEVGEGPAGIVVDDTHDRLYVLNRFESSISIVDTEADAWNELERVDFYDPTPNSIRDGRPLLYDTHATSGLGQASCASCHIDGRTDQVAWDLGNPAGDVKEFNQNCNGGILPACEDWHPMKGPMTTQTLFGITGTEPLHWRGDREELSAFNPAFESLLGDDEQLTVEEMELFAAFIESLTPPPNPFRNFDGSLPSSFSNGGDPQSGGNFFSNAPVDGPFTCATCHALPTGTNGVIISGNLLQETQSVKVPQLRNMHEKTGFDVTSSNNNRGFGYIHDGSVDTLFEFLMFSGFNFANDQQRRDVEAFMMCLATDTHAAVGVQTTVVDASAAPVEQLDLVDDMLSLADTNVVGVVVKGLQDGLQRGYAYIGGAQFQSDRAAEVLTAGELLSGAAPGSELTYTVVPFGTQTRIGIDRDEDGALDRDEIDAGSDPADPLSIPGGGPCAADLDGDGQVRVPDLIILLGVWGTNPGHPADLDGDGEVRVPDLIILLAAWGVCP